MQDRVNGQALQAGEHTRLKPKCKNQGKNEVKHQRQYPPPEQKSHWKRKKIKDETRRDKMTHFRHRADLLKHKRLKETVLVVLPEKGSCGRSRIIPELNGRAQV